MASKFLPELSQDFGKLYKEEIGYDVIIYAGEGTNVKEFHAHSPILCIRSQYFHSAFINDWAKKEEGKFIFRKENIAPHLFNIILSFIYSGNIELKNLQVPDVSKLLIAVDELNIQQLISHIQEYLIENFNDFDPMDILETVYHQHEALYDFFLEKICEEPKKLFDSHNFTKLDGHLLKLILERIDLNMDEIEVWENLLKWCMAKEKIEDDPNDLTKWNKKDIRKVKKSLHNFIPLIRFYDINATDFFYKVYRYKDILPQDLIHNLLEFHIVPNAKPKTDIPSRFRKLVSKLIYPKFLSHLASWIEKKDSSNYKNQKIPYEFKLLYSSSGEGFNAVSFHKNCDNQGATIWIARIQGSTRLIGGYNPLDWNGNCGYKTTVDSFLFNLEDGKNISAAELGYVEISSAAVYCNNQQGPSMGNLYCPNSKYWSYGQNGTCYRNIGISAKFTIENFEVLQYIVKVNLQYLIFSRKYILDYNDLENGRINSMFFG
ncbi:hypothetical protein C1645_805904 [Glomus cerebriforme]|uniref:BTB/POZ domain-containing protein n=1 Tax=Glomus cerebriforme TaxID=658196 RepID=A0A397T4V1_9GLOM|nr:hypothetical protein C1645_805904 [Glomus cerebriforme]